MGNSRNWIGAGIAALALSLGWIVGGLSMRARMLSAWQADYYAAKLHAAVPLAPGKRQAANFARAYEDLEAAWALDAMYHYTRANSLHSDWAESLPPDNPE